MAPKGFRLKQNYDAQPIDILKGKIPLDTSPGKFQVLLSTEHEIDRVPLSNKTRKTLIVVLQAKAYENSYIHGKMCLIHILCEIEICRGSNRRHLLKPHLYQGRISIWHLQ